MSNKYAFIRTKASFIIIGLILGLFTGFKVANSQYRRERGRAISSAVANSASSKSNNEASRATEAIKAIIDKAKANPNDAQAQMDAASQFIQIDRPTEAMTFLEQANKAKPNDPRIYAGIGVAQYMMQNLDQAATWLKRSRDLGAKDPNVTSLLIGAYIETRKNLDEADRLLSELESLGINPAELTRIRAELNAARDDKKTAVGGGAKTMLQHGPENSGGKN